MSICTVFRLVRLPEYYSLVRLVTVSCFGDGICYSVFLEGSTLSLSRVGFMDTQPAQSHTTLCLV